MPNLKTESSYLITLKTIDKENFNHYKKPAMVLGFPTCSFKCNKECGSRVCHNDTLASTNNILLNAEDVINNYLNNHLTSAIVAAGLEPLDSWNELKLLVQQFREQTLDDIVIYTGYKEEEISEQVLWLKQFKNIVIKFGRFVPNQSPHYDEVLGVNLASDNQYAKKVS